MKANREQIIEKLSSTCRLNIKDLILINDPNMTMRINASTRIVKAGVQFIEKHINHVGDLQFLITHEMYHPFIIHHWNLQQLVEEIRNNCGEDHVIHHPSMNIAQDAFINAYIRNTRKAKSDLPERFYSGKGETAFLCNNGTFTSTDVQNVCDHIRNNKEYMISLYVISMVYKYSYEILTGKRNKDGTEKRPSERPSNSQQEKTVEKQNEQFEERQEEQSKPESNKDASDDYQNESAGDTDSDNEEENDQESVSGSDSDGSDEDEEGNTSDTDVDEDDEDGEDDENEDGEGSDSGDIDEDGDGDTDENGDSSEGVDYNGFPKDMVSGEHEDETGNTEDHQTVEDMKETLKEQEEDKSKADEASNGRYGDGSNSYVPDYTKPNIKDALAMNIELPAQYEKLAGVTRESKELERLIVGINARARRTVRSTYKSSTMPTKIRTGDMAMMSVGMTPPLWKKKIHGAPGKDTWYIYMDVSGSVSQEIPLGRYICNGINSKGRGNKMFVFSSTGSPTPYDGGSWVYSDGGTTIDEVAIHAKKEKAERIVMCSDGQDTIHDIKNSSHYTKKAESAWQYVAKRTQSVLILVGSYSNDTMIRRFGHLFDRIFCTGTQKFIQMSKKPYPNPTMLEKLYKDDKDINIPDKIFDI